MRQATIIFFIVFACLVSGCAPGHQLLSKQFKAHSSGPILSTQGYVIDENERKVTLQKRWTTLAKVMRQQPGFISSRLSPGLGESTIWLAHSEWESLDALRKAFSDPEVLRLESRMPKQQFTHLFALGQKGQFAKNKP